jgi:hypothetical protein
VLCGVQKIRPSKLKSPKKGYTTGAARINNARLVISKIRQLFGEKESNV